MKEKQFGRYIGLLLIAALVAMPISPVMAAGSGTELSDQANSAESITLFSPQENIEGFDEELQKEISPPEALTEVSRFSIDPALVSATPYWVYLVAGKKEQLALIDFIQKSDTPSKKKTEWIQFLQATWKKYPLKFERKGSSATLGSLKPVQEYTLTKKEAATFAEIDRMIAADMEKTAEQEVGVRWARPQHVDFITIAMKNENIPDALKGVANQSAPLPDEWYTWDPTGVLARSMNHGYLITQYSPTTEGIGLAPQNTGTYALSAKGKYLLHDYSGAFTDLGYSSHFITDLGNPYHTPNLVLATWPNYDDPFSTESNIVRYKRLHDQYEGFVATYWSQPVPNGRTFSDYASSATGATIIVEPTTSAKYHAMASNLDSIPLYYLCSWHYLFNSNFEFQNNPAIVAITAERVIATTKNTRGLVRFVTGGQAPTLTITATAGEYGNISPAGFVTVNYGDTSSFTITPDNGYRVDQILVDNFPATQNPHTFSDVISDHAISATFRPVPSSTEWNWATDDWSDWQHTAIWSGGSGSEYGPVLVNDDEVNHGEHGADVSLYAGSTQASVWKTFIDPSGVGWNTITFKGLMTASDVPEGRWMTIDINNNKVFGGTASQLPPGNGAPFEITQSFTQSPTVNVNITHGQSPAWGPRFAVHYYSVKLSSEKTTTMMKTQSTPFVIPDGKGLVVNVTTSDKEN